MANSRPLLGLLLLLLAGAAIVLFLMRNRDARDAARDAAGSAARSARSAARDAKTKASQVAERVSAEYEAAGQKTCWRRLVSKVSKPWAQPHRLRVQRGDVEAEGVFQGPGQWQVALAEAGSGADSVGLSVSALDGAPITYAANYDSDKSRHKPPTETYGLKRVAFSAASKDDSWEDFDWAMLLDGQGPNWFAVTGDEDSVVYDGSLGIEVPIGKNWTALYAVDMKKRPTSHGLVPSWVRHGAALRHRSDLGDVRVVLNQPNPDKLAKGYPDLEVTYSGHAPGRPGSPRYTFRAMQEQGRSPAYDAQLRVQSPQGLAGGVDFTVTDGRPSISGFGELGASKEVAQGLSLGGDVKVVATPTNDPSEDRLSVHPINLKASADLAKLLPTMAAKGSVVDVRARYKLGAERPSVGMSAKLGTKTLMPMQLAAEGDVDDSGKVTGSLKLGGTGSDITASFHTHGEAGDLWGGRQVAEVGVPVSLPRGTGHLYGRFTQSGKDHGGKPRVQVGLQYGGNIKGTQMLGESAAYDSGTQLIAADGTPWLDAHLQKARGTAAAVRKQAGGSEGAGRRWLRG